MPVNPPGGGGAGGGGASRFYLSTAPAPGPGIYTDFNVLMAAFMLVPDEEVREIFVLDSLTLDEKTGGGGWDFTNATWMSTGLPGSVVVTTPAGFFCTVPPRLFQDIAVIHGGTAPFWSVTTPTNAWIRFDNGQLESASGELLFEIDSGGSLVTLWLDNDSQILKGSGAAGTRIYVGADDVVECRTTTGMFSANILETDVDGEWHQTNFSRDAATNVTEASQTGISPGTLTIDYQVLVDADAPLAVENGVVQWDPVLGAVVAITGTPQSNVDMGTALYVPITVAANAGITGITGGRDGRAVTLINTSNVPLIIFNDLVSTAANRIYTEGRIPSQTLSAYGSVTLIYDATLARWVVQGNSQGHDRHAPSSTLNATTILQHSTFHLAAGVTLPDLTAGQTGTSIRIVSTDLTGPINIVLPANGVSGAGWTIALSAGGGGHFEWTGVIWQCTGNS